MLSYRSKMNNQPISFIYVLFILLTFFRNPLASSSVQPHFLEKGATLSVEDHDTTFITSPDGSFTFGFYEIGTNAYSLAIWFTTSKNKTVVWMANREKPVNGVGSKFSFRKNGDMVLTDVDGRVSWQTNTTSAEIDRAELLNSGNLVIRNVIGDVKWQSFDYPTDTLLPNQNLDRNKGLVSSSRKGSYDPGYFRMIFDCDNILRLVFDGPEISYTYWPNPDESERGNGRNSYISNRLAVLDDTGRFFSSDDFKFNTTDMGFGIKRRMTLDYDGNLRVHSLNNSTGLWQVSWQALIFPCSIRGRCGMNGICIYSPHPKCSCPPGYEVTDPSNWYKGCKPTFDLSSSINQPMKFVKISQIDYYGYFDINHTENVSLEACQKICLEDSNCKAIIYWEYNRNCWPKSALFNGQPVEHTTLWLKVPQNLPTSKSVKLDEFQPRCASIPKEQVETYTSLYVTRSRRVIWIYLYSFCSAIFGIEVVLLGWFFLFRKSNVSDTAAFGDQMIASQFRRFSYNELKKATNNFKEELGRGGSGVVYKGALADGRVIAVKRLGDVHQGDEEFLAEMSIIGKINHMNLVRTWGYCSEKRKKLLVYEYVENSSLDKHLFRTKFLGWKQRFAVALGTAKGLAYLHEECLEWVIHCDIKPENILLDRDLQPKIADFGLAKLYQRGGGSGLELSKIRGTKGYMAPEWALNQPITAKVDVYSYGIVILGLVRGIKLSNWIMNDRNNQPETELTKLMRIIKEEGEESWIRTVVDPRLEGNFIKKQAITLIKVGVSCVQEDRNKRPQMASVVETLLQSASTNDEDTDCIHTLPPNLSSSVRFEIACNNVQRV